MKKFVMRRRTLVALFALACVFTIAGVAWAAIGTGGVVKTCFSQAKATWRPIDNSANCRSGEQSINFYSKAGADATFLGVNSKAADSDKLDGIDSTGFLGATGKAADSDKLDGIDSTGFLGATAQAADSEKLDGIDSSGFVQGGGTRRAGDTPCNGCSVFPTDSSLGRLVTVCSSFFNTMGLQLQTHPSSAPAGDYQVWSNIDGTASYQTVTKPDTVFLQFPLDMAEHEIKLKVLGPTGDAGTWDASMHYAPLPGNPIRCEGIVFEEIMPLS